jgi:hypothetical protein
MVYPKESMSPMGPPDVYASYAISSLLESKHAQAQVHAILALAAAVKQLAQAQGDSK